MEEWRSHTGADEALIVLAFYINTNNNNNGKQATHTSRASGAYSPAFAESLVSR